MVDFPKVAFIGWNPFQFLHVKDLASSIPGAIFIIEKRNDYAKNLLEVLIANTDIKVMFLDKSKISDLDGVFDVIVCQTLFFKIEVFVKTKILMIQYGYAKEPHNYGAWRALGDLCLTYGDYASKKISYFCPSVSIGNPRYDKWHNIINNTLPSQNKDVSLKKILYAPTWGDLSSIDNYLNDIIALSENYVVMLKLHHNTDCLESYIKRKIDNRIYCYGANDDILDLINESDIVISDYSGAIFDAVYFKKPIILLNKEIHYDNNGKIDSFSIEYARRSELGYEVNNPEELFYAVQYVLNNKELFSSMHASLRNELFLDNGRSIELAIKAIYDLHSGVYKINQQQTYIRATVKDLLITKRKFKKLIIK